MAHLKTVSATTKTWSELSADVIAVGIFSGGKLTPMAKDVDAVSYTHLTLPTILLV